MKYGQVKIISKHSYQKPEIHTQINQDLAFRQLLSEKQGLQPALREMSSEQTPSWDP